MIRYSYHSASRPIEESKSTVNYPNDTCESTCA
jgi:hypothetical protein